MRILHTVEAYYPEVGGMAEVVRQLSERLAARGHEITVATRSLPGRPFPASGKVKIVDFPVAGNLARGLTGEVDAYRAFLLAGGFDVVTAFAAQQWTTDALLPLLGELPARKVFVPTGFSGLGQPVYAEYFASMPGWLKQFDKLVFCGTSCRDAVFARRFGLTNTEVIPNGAAADEFLGEYQDDLRRKLAIPENHFLVLHVGSHTWLKGHSEVIEIFARAAILAATLLLIGNGTGGCFDECSSRAKKLNSSRKFRSADKRILLADLNRAETVACFKSADLFLFPSAIECSPIVLFESMASRTPFMTTDVGNAREIVDWSGGGVMLPTRCNNDLNFPGRVMLNKYRDLGECLGWRTFSPLDSFARADVPASATLLTSLWHNPSRRLELAESGFRAWDERFTWERITLSYEALYQDLLQELNVGKNEVGEPG